LLPLSRMVLLLSKDKAFLVFGIVMTGLQRKRSKRAISGLETAIILIAFIIVASTFAFTILNLGFMTAQKSGQVVQNGIQLASSSLDVDGSVVALGSGNSVQCIQFEIHLSPGGDAIDLSLGRLIVSYQSEDIYVPNIYNQNASRTRGGVTISPITGTGMILKSGDTFLINVYLNGTSSSGSPPVLADPLVPYEEFTIELKPAMSAVVTIDRTIPAAISPTMDLG
jgi:archaeal flagellin FlaB